MAIRLFLISFLAITGFLAEGLYAQADVIRLDNPSFEGVPHVGSDPGDGPRLWVDCGKDGETPPDVQPSYDPKELFFGVTTKPNEGRTYVGMVVRENDTNEGIGQRLKVPLEMNKCYTFSLDLAKSPRYISPNPKNPKEMFNHSKPVKIRIWGGEDYCRKRELLDESTLVNHPDWRKYNFRFEPQRTHKFILIEAFFRQPTLFPYNGNVLIDNASAIHIIPCDDQPLASIDETRVNVSPTPASPATPEPPPVTYNKPPAETPAPRAKEEKLLGFDKKNLEKGQKIRIANLYFKADSSNFNMTSLPELDKIYLFLVDNPEVIIELGGHTNNRCEDSFCDKLSKARAKAVADYLADRGVPWRQLKFRGYGKHNPTNTNYTPTGRKRNQRVEIMILELDAQ